MIFDLLLQEGQIKLSANQTILSAAKLKNRKYSKFYNIVSHNLQVEDVLQGDSIDY
jgi:hypothetical protein